MKKAKWLINIATLCLCVCAIAIGVYAAKTVSLTASGTIGFTAHGVDYRVKATIDHYKDDGTETAQAVPTALDGETTISGSATKSLGTMYFSDLVTGGNVITITLEITNKSAFGLSCTITPTVTGIENVTASPTSTGAVYIPQEDTITQVITLTHSNLDGVKTFEVEDAVSIGATLTRSDPFASRSVLKIADTDDKANTDTGLDKGSVYVEMGAYDKDGNGTIADSEKLRWYAFAQDGENGEMTSFYQIETDTNGDDVIDINDLPAGTYYFISEYCIDGVAFNSSSNNQSSDLNYNESDLQSAITSFADNEIYGETSGDTKVKIKNTSLYKYIMPRDLMGESFTYYPNAASSDWETRETKTQTNTYGQYLWPLSLDELKILGGHGDTPGDPSKYECPNCATTNLLSKKTADSTSVTTAEWWLRSPFDNRDNFRAYLVDSSGSYFKEKVTLARLGFRPAFKLVIA